ncbi:MAG TPA: mycothiol system anti-sigma-R factor [bacterium]|jgi:mycothiol system anti-sigma-R factor
MRRLRCDEVLHEVWGFLDGEIEETRYVEIQAHVEECEGCGPRYEFQRRLMTLIQIRCKQPLPESVRQRLLRLLDE